MSDETLSTELQYATVSENVAGTPTPITTWDVPEGIAISIAQGSPAILDVEAKDGGNVSRSTKIGFGYREPNDPLDSWTVISEFAVSPFNTLSLKDQQSGENAQRRRVRFLRDRVPNGRLTLEDADELALLVNGPDVVDPATLFFNYPMQVDNR